MSDFEEAGGPLYPNERAFLVKFRRDATAAPPCEGRVEHVLSGRVDQFTNPEHLLRLMIEMIEHPRPPS